MKDIRVGHHNLSELLSERTTKIEAEKELRQARANLEYDITEYLVQENMSEFFSVNWTRLNRLVD